MKPYAYLLSKSKLSFLSFLLLLFGLTSLYSQSLIAVQNGNTPSFYEDANEAFDNAVEGDTLYFPGGSYSLNRTIDKTLHIIGTGHNPNSTTFTGTTIFSSETEGTPQLIYNTGGGGTVTGIAFTFHTNCSGGVSCWNIRIDSDIDNLILDRNYLPKGIFCYQGIIKNVLLTRSILETFHIQEVNSNGVLPSGLITNNIISSRFNYAKNLVIENNFFIAATGNGNPNSPPLHAFNSLVQNNIFHRYAITSILTVSMNSSFRNNFGIPFNGVSGNNYGSGAVNYVAEFNQLFVNFTSNLQAYEFDLHLVDDSPLLTASNSGGQIGIYGGRFPWKDGSTPFNPHIVSKNISGTTDENGNLPVQIEVQAQDN